jgi:uncharacterized protein (TIGR02453 family)
MSDFQGFPQEGIDFLSDLRSNNDKGWFDAHKKTYETSVKEPMVRLVEAVNARLSAFAPDYRADPRKAISRLHRDTRFSADKSPFKTEISAVLPRSGAPKEEVAGFFFSLSPDGVRLLGGAYMPGPAQLTALQSGFRDGHAELRQILAAPALREAFGEMQGETFKRVPGGYPADHPAADLLRHKQAYFEARLPVEAAVRADLPETLSERFRLLVPFVTFLDEALAQART